MADMTRDLSAVSARWAATRETAARQWAVEQVLANKTIVPGYGTVGATPEKVVAAADKLASYVLEGPKT
jgi:hypothetical protein